MTRARPVAAPAALLFTLLAAAAGPLSSQSAARGVVQSTTQSAAPYRFEITATGDSTFTIAIGKENWLRLGQRGIAVDPRRRDVLVARFQIVALSNGSASALVVGQTVPITTDHVALVSRPLDAPTPFYKQRGFWMGIAAGAAIGMGVGFSR